MGLFGCLQYSKRGRTYKLPRGISTRYVLVYQEFILLKGLFVRYRVIAEKLVASFLKPRSYASLSFTGAIFVYASDVVFRGENVFTNNTAIYGGGTVHEI